VDFGPGTPHPRLGEGRRFRAVRAPLEIALIRKREADPLDAVIERRVHPTFSTPVDGNGSVRSPKTSNAPDPLRFEAG
jgi:hypothetical protein